MKQLAFLPDDDHGIRRAPPEPRPRKPPKSAPLAKDGQAQGKAESKKLKAEKETTAPLVKDGQSLVMGSLTTGARYEPRCLVCGVWLTMDETPPRYPVPICAGCMRARGGKV